MKHLFLAAAALALAAVPALASEATFERTLSVNGRVELTVATGSGNIHLTHGSGNQVHIFGKVKSGWGGSEDRVREIAAHPPIEQTGNIVRIGARHENLHNISIDYEIQAPENSFLDAGSGSGDIVVDGVGENAKLNTGSGNIRATGLRGGFTVGTGSGDIYAEQTGAGDVKAETGSGKVELRNLHGACAPEPARETSRWPERRPPPGVLRPGPARSNSGLATRPSRWTPRPGRAASAPTGRCSRKVLQTSTT